MKIPTSALWISLTECAWVPILYGPLFAIPVIFLIVFAIYAIDHASDSAEDRLNRPGRAAKDIVKYAYSAYFIAIVAVAWWDYSRLFAVIVPGIFGFSYRLKVKGQRLKDMPGVKTLLVTVPTAICYGGLCGGGYMLVFLVTIINTVICDLRDLSGDRASGVRTIPVLLGKTKTLLILSLIDVAIFAISPTIAIIGFFLIWYFRKERPNLAYDILVDGWMLWVILIESLKYFAIVQSVASI